jgi:hypothetical protein
VDDPGDGRGVTFDANDYWAADGRFSFRWNGNRYTGYAAWRSAAGVETRGLGVSKDPKLPAAGKGGTVGNADRLSSLSAYRLPATSPVAAAGLALGLSGVTDFFGNPVPSQSRPSIGAAQGE